MTQQQTLPKRRRERITIEVQPETQQERDLIYRFWHETGAAAGPSTRVLILAAIKRAQEDGRMV